MKSAIVSVLILMILAPYNFSYGQETFAHEVDQKAFLYWGKISADGTRSGGFQEDFIENMNKTGIDTIHFQIFRMRICNILDKGDDQQCPFVHFDPSVTPQIIFLNQN